MNNKTPKTKGRAFPTKQREAEKKKNIELVIHELIDEVLNRGHKPREIRLTREAYDELEIRTESFDPPGYEVVPIGVVYHPEPTPKRIQSYMGLPVIIDDKIAVLWR